MKIAVIGLGYVGAVTSVCLARDGHEVIGVDLDRTKLALIREGRAPIVEDGISTLTSEAVASGRLQVTNEIDAGLSDCDLIFVCVGTPSASNGAQDLGAVRRVAAQVGSVLSDANGFPVVVIRSTVYPGTTEDVVKPILEDHADGTAGETFGLCFQPEFLREGSSVKDFYNPPFTVVGTSCDRSANKVRELFGALPGEFLVTSFGSAEMLKLSCNVFHALKISFANEIGRMCQSIEVDSREVMDLICKDTSLNISPAYLKPGFAFGGSCLPKDLRAMLYLSRTRDVDLPVIKGVQETNLIHIQHAAQLVMDSGSRKIGFVGLSFKPGTDDLRESPLVTLAETLIGKGYDLRIYDPAVNVARLVGANKAYIEKTIPHIESLLTDSLEEVLQHSEVLVLGQRHESMESEGFPHSPDVRAIIDLVGIESLSSVAAEYNGVCW